MNVPASLSWSIALNILKGMSLIVMLCGQAAAQPHLAKSNTQLILDGSMFDAGAGDNVALFGLIHVQTRFDLPTGAVAVHANIREEAFLAYVLNDQTPNSPLLERLKSLQQTVQDLKGQIVDLQGYLLALQAELQQVLETDIYPLIPGHQIDEGKAAALQAQLAEASADLQRLRQQLIEALDEIKSLIDEIQDQADEGLSLYAAAGAYTAYAPNCSSVDQLCESIVTFNLERPYGDSIRFHVLLSLQFSQQGELVSVEADLGCETISCSVDQDVCTCS